MLYITDLDEGLEIFKTLGSEIRIEIIKALTERSMSMNELATHLNITAGALTSHIRKLESTGIITISNEAGSHGNLKLCSLHMNRILIELGNEAKETNINNISLKVGHYSDFSVLPTCGLASASQLIGSVDDPRYFNHPDRYNADILWFSRGYVEYVVPNLIPTSQDIKRIIISAELSSEAPTFNENWPSDISFYLNNVCIGSWTSPGDFGEIKGLLTPNWWYRFWNQYGLLKFIIIDDRGTFVDGLQISSVTINDLHLERGKSFPLRFAVNDDAENIGGLTIYGRSFGNYEQDINITLKY